jgi:F0F1-type ATP synthase assembly protein I
MNKYIVFAAMGFELVGIIIACLFLGQWLDRNYGTRGLGLVGCSVLGLAGWLVHIVQLTKNLDKNQDQNSQ